MNADITILDLRAGDRRTIVRGIRQAGKNWLAIERTQREDGSTVSERLLAEGPRKRAIRAAGTDRVFA